MDKIIWVLFTALLTVGGIYVGLVENRMNGLDRMINAHRIELTEVPSRITGLEARVQRIEQDLRNHNIQFDSIRTMILTHDEKMMTGNGQKKNGQ